MKGSGNGWCCLPLLFGAVGRAGAVMFLETADPLHHATTPGGDSGWQYEGRCNNFLGVPIPLVRLENLSGADRLTIEFVRRTAASGANLTYQAEFFPDLEDWQSVGTETVVAINARWERVRIVDVLTAAESPRRFGRLRVRMAE